MSTACTNCSVSNVPSARRNFMRFSDARLQAESSTCMYSEQGLEALMRPEFGLVCRWLTVVTYSAPGSAQRMNETGPDAVPPLLSGSIDPRMLERLMPEPEPPRKILPSLVFQSRIESIVSSTLRMKQAEHCGCSSKPTLNQTGLLNAASW